MPTIATVVGVGVSVAGAAGAFAPDSPEAMNYGQITRDAQKAQIELIPEKFAAKNLYDSQFLELQQRLNQQALFGTPAGRRQVTSTTPKKVAGQTITLPMGSAGPPGAVLKGSDARGQNQYWQLPDTTQDVTATEWVDSPGAPGQLDLIEQAMPRANALVSAQRAAGLKDVRDLGPEAARAIAEFDPTSAGILDKLGARAQERLDLNGELDPFMERSLDQSIASDQAERGLGYGPADAAIASYYKASTREKRRRADEAAAGGVVGLRQGFYGDPFQIIAGTQSGRATNPLSYYSDAPSPVGEVNPAAYGIAGANQSAQNQANIAGYNSQMEGLGSLANIAGRYGAANYKGKAPAPAASPYATNFGYGTWN